MTPTQRALAECRKRGYRAQVVERRLPRGFTTIDLFGCIDVVALDGKPGLLGIQVTSGSNAAARIRKIGTECKDAIRDWLGAGNRLEVWGYAKRGEAGKRKLWTLRVATIVNTTQSEEAA